MSVRYPIGFLSIVVLAVAASVGGCALDPVDDTAGGPWVWVAGSDLPSQSGVYGTMGVAAPSNEPGARDHATTWTTAEGTFWLFGGRGRDQDGTRSDLNDLWTYDGTSWTWVGGSDTVLASGVYGTKGVSHADNMPGARRRAASWVDATGRLWLFGGQGYDADGVRGYLNDLWVYHSGTGMWTWVGGSDTVLASGVYGTKGVSHADNVPGARRGVVTWVDDFGRLWLFGGAGFDKDGWEGVLNDLWRFDLSAGRWTWVAGGNEIDPEGVYGTRGVPDGANTPGGRRDGAGWVDSNGLFWTFGGYGYGSGEFENGPLNDLWSYSVATGEWTWVTGSDVPDAPGVYGTQGVPAADNTPGARRDSADWVGEDGRFYLYGGNGKMLTASSFRLDGVWRFDPATGHWTWLSGGTVGNNAPAHGTRGVATPSTTPGGRRDMAAFGPVGGALWLFGGQSRVSGSDYEFNDLWRYQP